MRKTASYKKKRIELCEKLWDLLPEWTIRDETCIGWKEKREMFSWHIDCKEVNGFVCYDAKDLREHFVEDLSNAKIERLIKELTDIQIKYNKRKQSVLKKIVICKNV